MSHENVTSRQFWDRFSAAQRAAEMRAAQFPADTPEKRLRRMARAVVDPEYFARTYLPHYFTDEGSPFHRVLHLLYTFEKYGVVRAPRGHAKTTVGTFNYGCHQAVCGKILKAWQDGTLEASQPELYQEIWAQIDAQVKAILTEGSLTCRSLGLPDHWDAETEREMDEWLADVYARVERTRTIPLHYDPYIQILAVTVDQAIEFTSAIRLELEDNALLRSDWGDLTPCHHEDWGRKRRRPASMDDYACNGVRVRAFGMNGNVRGGKHGPDRPTLVLGDDLENEENTRTEGQREANFVKSTRVLDKGLDSRRKRCFFVGTPVHYDCTVCRLTTKVEYKRRWIRLRFRAADESGRLLYPAKWDLDMLEEERQLDPEGYGSELDDKPPQEFGHPFVSLGYYHREDYAEKDLPKVMAFDPSLGRTKSSDFQALVNLRGPTAEGDVLVDRCELWRIPVPKVLVGEVIRVVEEVKPTAKVMESIGFQSLLAFALTDEADRQQVEDGGWLLIEYQAESKDLRIRAMGPRVNGSGSPTGRKGRLLFPDDGSCRQLERQFTAYPQGKRDGVDTTEMALRFIDDGGSDWGWT